MTTGTKPFTEQPARSTNATSGSTLPRESAQTSTGDFGRRLPRERLAGLDDRELATELTALAKRLSAGTYELLVLVGEVDARGTWALWGALSCAAWLAEVGEVEMVTAHNQVRVARALRIHPALDQAMAHGEVSYAKARVLVPYLDADNAVELVALAEHTPAARLGAAIAARSLRHDDPEVIAERQHQARSVSWRTDGDGTVVITARLTPQNAGRVCAVLDQQVMQADAAQGASLCQQRADAFVGCVTAGGGAVDSEVVVHVRIDGNTLEDGTPLADHAVTAMLPEAFVSLLMTDAERQPIDASPRRRFPTRRQRRVIDARHPECAHPGCHARAFLQCDHVHPYIDGGPTIIANLQRLCGPHNRAKERARSARTSSTPNRAA